MQLSEIDSCRYVCHAANENTIGLELSWMSIGQVPFLILCPDSLAFAFDMGSSCALNLILSASFRFGTGVFAICL